MHEAGRAAGNMRLPVDSARHNCKAHSFDSCFVEDGVGSGMRVLDVGSGSGDCTADRRLARQSTSPLEAAAYWSPLS
jgi:hypothetical protein